MRLRVTALFAMAVVCFSAAYGQTIDEERSAAVFGEDGLKVSFSASSPTGGFETRLTVELLDEKGSVRSQSSKFVRIPKGRSEHSVILTIEETGEKAREDFVWYRVRYRMGSAYGIVSLTQLLKDFFEVSVAATTVIRPGQTFTARVRANEPFKKRPVEGVEIKAVLELELDTDSDEDELDIERTGITDRDGYVSLVFKIPENIVIDWVEDFTVTASKDGYVREVDTYMTAVENGNTVFLTVDKPIYQPGQNFNVRALLFDINRSVITGGEIEFRIYDGERTLLFSETVETSEFGVASVAWAIPDNAKLGEYVLEAETDSDEPSGGTLRFKVTRYDLPNFTVNAKPDKAFYLPGDKRASIEVSADYLFGKPVAEGSVKVVLEKARKWNWKAQKYDVEEAQTIEGKTAADGSFVAQIDLEKAIEELNASKWVRFKDLNLAAYFTDTSSNRTEQKRFDIRLSREPIHTYLMVGGYRFNPDLPVTAYISSFYADGTPAECEFRVEGRKSENEEGEFAVLTEGRTNRYGAAKTSFRKPDFGEADDDLEVRITAVDGKGAAGTFEDVLSFADDPAIDVSVGKAVLAPGEPIRISIRSSQKAAKVYLDLVSDWSVAANYDVELTNGRAEVEVPYKPEFRGETQVWAYFEYIDEDDDIEVASSTTAVIYPEQQNLLLDAQFSEASYKPGEDAEVGFSVRDGSGSPAKSALGVVVFDKAIEERARTDAEFGSYFGRFGDWLGYSRNFSGVTLRDLNEIDTSKPVSEDLQLVAEFVLARNYGYYRPDIDRSEINLRRASYIFKEYFETQFEPIEKALRAEYAESYDFPKDESSLNAILEKRGLSFEALTDPWGQKYRPVFSVYRSDQKLTFESSGADKRFDTKDDFSVNSMAFGYFARTSRAISAAAADVKEHTGGFIRDYATLRDVLRGRGIELDELRDPWGNKYDYQFSVDGRNYAITVRSAGPDGKLETYIYQGDDFDVARTGVDYFGETEGRINAILSNEANREAWKFPETEEEFWQLMERGGLEKGSVRDGYGREAYVEVTKTFRYSDTNEIVDGRIAVRPVTEELVTAEIRSPGSDGKRGDGSAGDDDFRLARFTSAISQWLRDASKATANIRNITYSGSAGAIRGTVTDPTGAVIPGATASATNRETGLRTAVTTNNSGVFLIPNLPSGLYDLRVEASGFLSFVYSNIRVRSFSLSEIDVTLEVGAVSAMVSVEAGAVEVIDQSSTVMQLVTENAGNPPNTTGPQIQTPRLREYFPETLVWAPEVITGDDGRAELKFKMADNITTWKMYTIASTKNGKIGVAENEVIAFQPFFADLEPPKFLTTGDEIHLPVQIRNYTPEAQSVNVTMDRGDWFSFLGGSKQTIDVPSNASENAVFGFRAEHAVGGGKQRVTAIATGDSDAIEKPVTVRPNGQEVTNSETKLFSGSASFRVDTPEYAIGEGRAAALKIYPNLLANVADSASGLLKRPYGCGEQTISSTYPNLMILKLAPADSPFIPAAEEFLRKGYERLLGYQVSTGGFTYWGKEDSEDLALTAYAIRFLKDASAKIDVDDSVIRKAERWLLSKQNGDGSWSVISRWSNDEESRRTRMITSYIARSLAMGRVESEKPSDLDRSLAKALAYLRARNSELEEPYSLALYGLASLDAGFADQARSAADKLRKMAIPEGSSFYWNLETNTPFYGWGRAGRIETTALVVQLLAKLSTGDERDAVRKGTLFLMKNKDRYGVWYSTQTTINVLDAILATIGANGNGDGQRQAAVKVNGKVVRTLALPPVSKLTPAIEIDLSGEMALAGNEIELDVDDETDVMAQVVATHYVPWPEALDSGPARTESGTNLTPSRLLELDYSCDRTDAKVMEEVTCAVKAERVGFRGYGMLLAEIGIPPGADVSRESLEKEIAGNYYFSRYDILPDRLIVYMWAQPGGTKFNFTFRPRYGINAQTPPSVVYDYYNDEARAVVAPLKFRVLQ